MSSWDGTDRRSHLERRKRERRRSVRYAAETLVVIHGVTWVDDDGADRRRKIRRRRDREKVSNRILGDLD
jgi:hypothetical protein